MSTYTAWVNMHTRCTNPNYHGTDRYRGRGIMYCAKWERFDIFLKEMGEKPEGTQLERSNNNEGYYKENCVWATATQQARNRRVRRTSKTGVSAVHWCTTFNIWLAKDFEKNTLYRGQDFFEACCARKSFEAKVKNGLYS